MSSSTISAVCTPSAHAVAIARRWESEHASSPWWNFFSQWFISTLSESSEASMTIAGSSTLQFPASMHAFASSAVHAVTRVSFS